MRITIKEMSIIKILVHDYFYVSAVYIVNQKYYQLQFAQYSSKQIFKGIVSLNSHSLWQTNCE